MDVGGGKVSNLQSGCSGDEQDEMMMDLRRGPWTVEEDLTLVNYIAKHGEGRWNSLARCAGLKRTGKSCRLRWLNYLRPDVRRGNITLEEQLLIIELHSQWGNRWSKIAQHLPGRTDNEIKNYWRTRVQKHAKQLKCDVNSKQFKDTMRYLWMPRLLERIQAASATNGGGPSSTSCSTIASNNHFNSNNMHANMSFSEISQPQPGTCGRGYALENSSTTALSDFFRTQVSPASDLIECYYPIYNGNNNKNDTNNNSNKNQENNQGYYPIINTNNINYYQDDYSDSLSVPYSYVNSELDTQSMEQCYPWFGCGDMSDNLWNAEDIQFLQK